MKVFITKIVSVFIITTLAGFCFWCGYQVGTYERDWEKTHQFNIIIPQEERIALPPIVDNNIDQQQNIDHG